MVTSSLRSMPQTKTSQFNFSMMSITRSPSRPNSGRSLNFKSSARPLANVSICMAEGKRRSFAISLAVASSGLIIIEIPSCSLIKLISLLYMELRTLAMVWHCPAFRAMRQQRRFSSSEAVTAIKRSASSTPASNWTL